MASLVAAWAQCLPRRRAAHLIHCPPQVKLALCQLHVTADKDKNIATARQAIQVSWCRMVPHFGGAPNGHPQLRATAHRFAHNSASQQQF